MKENKTKNRKWEPFFLHEVFSVIQRGKRLTKAQQIPGDTPYVSSKMMFNGVDGFISNENGVRRFNNCLTIANSGSVGSIFFHPYEFVASDHVTALVNENFTEEQYLFIASCMKAIGDKYFFNREINDARIKREKVVLPVTENGDPDWDFMNEFVNSKKIGILESYNQPSLNIIKDKRELDELTWEQFKMDDIFTINSGVRLTKADMKPGKIPFIGATDSNNGITQFTSTTNNSLDSNVLGVNYNGSVVENFYHPYKAVFSDDVKRLKLKNYPNNRHVLLFMKTIILQQKVKYAYGYKFNATRMKEQIILLPSKDDGTPDYEFMEQYMKRQENKVISQIKREEAGR